MAGWPNRGIARSLESSSSARRCQWWRCDGWRRAATVSSPAALRPTGDREDAAGAGDRAGVRHGLRDYERRRCGATQRQRARCRCRCIAASVSHHNTNLCPLLFPPLSCSSWRQGALGASAASERHALFDWAARSQRGLVLFIDEAEAFLGSRRSVGAIVTSSGGSGGGGSGATSSSEADGPPAVAAARALAGDAAAALAEQDGGGDVSSGGGKSSSSGGGMDEGRRNALHALLYHTGAVVGGGSSNGSGVLLVLATNRPGDLDPAVSARLAQAPDACCAAAVPSLLSHVPCCACAHTSSALPLSLSLAPPRRFLPAAAPAVCRTALPHAAAGM